MAKGGKQPGAGRPKGAVNKKTRIIAALLSDKMAAGERVSPLEVMTEAMQQHYNVYRNAKQAGKKAAALREAVMFAEKAAPYLHHRLASTTIAGDKDAPLSVTIINDIPRPEGKPPR
jgi:hypothetical protein